MQTRAHSGHINGTGVQRHSAGDNFPVIVTIVGDYPRPESNGFYRVSNQGVSRDCSDRAGRDYYVDLHKNAERITDAIFAARANGDGCTVSVDGTDLPVSGYVSGVLGGESWWDCSGLTYKTVYADVFNKLETLSATRFQGEPVCIGSWIYDGKLFCDVSIVFVDVSEALKYADFADQIAIFDLGNGTEINVSEALGK